MNQDTTENSQPLENEFQAKHWGFWATAGWAFLIFILWQIFQIIIIVIFIVSQYGGNDLGTKLAHYATSGTPAFTAIIIGNIISSLLVVGVIKIKRHSILKDYLALNLPSLKTTIYWVAAFLIFMVISDFIRSNLSQDVVPEVSVKMYYSTDPILLAWIGIVLAAPIFEEIFFRGFLHKAFSKSYLKPIGATFLISFLWAIIHLQYDLIDMTVIFAAGLLIGFSRTHSKSLYIPILLHMINNLLSTIQIEYHQDIQAFMGL